MFGDKLTTANAKITALLGIIASTGFKLNAEAISDPKTEASAVAPLADAFKTHLGAQQTAAITAATEPLATKLAAADSQLSTLNSQLVAYRDGLSEAGVKLGDFVTSAKADGATDEEKAKAAATANAAMVKTAVANTVAGKSAQQIAGAGHSHALDVAPGGSDTPSAAATPASKADFHAALNAIADPGERTAYFRKHKARFGL